VLVVLIVDGVDAALTGAFALVGAVGDEEECDPDDGEDGEKYERNHQQLPGPSPTVMASRAVAASPLLLIRCRSRGCSRLKA
jgi:hypothetical protein